MRLMASDSIGDALPVDIAMGTLFCLDAEFFVFSWFKIFSWLEILSSSTQRIGAIFWITSELGKFWAQNTTFLLSGILLYLEKVEAQLACSYWLAKLERGLLLPFA